MRFRRRGSAVFRRGSEDYHYWLANDRAVLRRLNARTKDARRSPFEGICKLELLRGDLSGWWSRRITDEQRLIYRVARVERGQVLEFAGRRFH